MEYGVICKKCGKQSSATKSTQTIRCYGCEELISVGKRLETISSRTNGQSSQEQVKIITDAKCPHNPFRKKSGNTNPKIDSPSSMGNSSRFESISTWETIPGKRALLCGVTYENQKFKLTGTIYDVNCMRELLVDRFHFPSSSIHILLEDEEHHHPTKKNIQAALQWLAKDCKPGDSLVFYFSGHGLQQPDFNEDERDGFDETICPLDFRTAGMISDNEINRTIVRPLKQGVRLHAIVDACHSGTVLDLPYVYSIKEKRWLGCSRINRKSWVGCSRFNRKRWVDNQPPSGVNKGTDGGLAVCFSACEDDQLAVDASDGEMITGAMTYNFMKAVKNDPKITYDGLLTSMHKAIKDARKTERFSLRGIFRRNALQKPLLSSSENFDVNTELKL